MNAPELTHALGGTWSGYQGWAICPAHTERSPSLSIRQGDRGALLKCFGGCEREAVIAAIREMGVSLTGANDDFRPVPSQRKQRDPAVIDRLWRACRVITSTDPAGKYLLARRCALPHVEGDLRWHHSLWHPCGHKGPGLVARVTDATDATRVLSLHKTWLAGDGSNRKAFDHLPKPERPKNRLTVRGMPLGHGYCIRLWPDCEVTYGLWIGEGIESTLALAGRGSRPVWSTINVEGLASFPVLYGIDELTIAVDNDPSGAGQRAALACSERWQEAGIETNLIYPLEPGKDLADEVPLSISKEGLLPDFDFHKRVTAECRALGLSDFGSSATVLELPE